MATASTVLIPLKLQRTAAATLAIYIKEAKYEFLKYLRLPVYSASTLLFPVMFYILFGLIMGNHSAGLPVSITTYLIATYGTFGVMGASLFANGVGIASERGLGWTQVKRASPMPAFAYFAAKTAVSLLFSLIVVLLLLVLGVAFGGVRLAAQQAIELVATLAASAIPFCALGLAIGYFAGPNSAPAVVNLIYLPMSFASGLWIPVEFLPRFVQRIAGGLPAYHSAQLALNVLHAGSISSPLRHWEYLIGFTLLSLGVARIGFQRDEGKMYG
jgi:ABC-2 type transport system permease protein